MPRCKYCDTQMRLSTNHTTKTAYYMCPECGSRGPGVKYANRIGWENELEMKTIGRFIDVKSDSAEDDLRNRNDVLSGRYSKLKSLELPSVNRILRETSQQMMDLQCERSDHDKAGYLDAMSGLYHKKATYLRYKAGYENELRLVREQIRENKRKLKELRDGGND
jgi:hypothetical protein